MSKEKKTIVFDSEQVKSRSEIAEFLKKIAQKIESGKVTLKSGQNETVVEIPGKAILEVQVDKKQKKSKGIQHQLEIEIKWYDSDVLDDNIEIN